MGVCYYSVLYMQYVHGIYNSVRALPPPQLHSFDLRHLMKAALFDFAYYAFTKHENAAPEVYMPHCCHALRNRSESCYVD